MSAHPYRESAESTEPKSHPVERHDVDIKIDSFEVKANFMKSGDHIEVKLYDKARNITLWVKIPYTAENIAAIRPGDRFVLSLEAKR